MQVGMSAPTQDEVGDNVTEGVLLASGVRRGGAGVASIGAVAVTLDGPHAVAHDGPLPVLEWLAAFLAGSDHLPGGAGPHHTPGDLVWAKVPSHGVALVCGRAGRVFHARERDEFHVLGGIVDSLPVKGRLATSVG